MSDDSVEIAMPWWACYLFQAACLLFMFGCVWYARWYGRWYDRHYPRGKP